MSMGTMLYDEHPVYNLGYIEADDFREVLDQDEYGLFRRKGYKIPNNWKKKYLFLKKQRNKELFKNFKRHCCMKTFINDILTLIKLLRLG